MYISGIIHQRSGNHEADNTAVKHAVYMVHFEHETLALKLSADVYATATEESVTFNILETASGYLSTVEWSELSEEKKTEVKELVRQEILSSKPFIDHKTGE